MKHASTAIDPFATPNSVTIQQPTPVVVTAAKPKATPINAKTEGLPAVAVQTVKPIVPATKPFIPIAMPLPPKPATQVAALKVVEPVVAVAQATPAATPPVAAAPLTIIVPAADTIVAAKPEPVATEPQSAAEPPVAAAAPVPVKAETPLVLAEAVPPPVVQIQAPDTAAKSQERIEVPPVPVEKTAEQLVPQRTQGDTFSDCDNCPELVVVAGTPDEGVIKALNANYSGGMTSLEPFAIGEYEITFQDWDACVADGGCTTQPSDDGWGRGKRPVIHVSFNDINDQYLPWLTRVAHHTYRLPSEAEWEFAVRGGSSANQQFAYSFGNDVSLLCDYGNSSDLAAKTADSNWAGTPCNDGFATTAPVGSLKPNPLGIYDMHGNVWEWVSDCLRSGYSADPAKNAFDCNFRVLRGGSWASPAPALRSAERGWEKPGKEKNSIGFRVARSLP